MLNVILCYSRKFDQHQFSSKNNTELKEAVKKSSLHFGNEPMRYYFLLPLALLVVGVNWHHNERVYVNELVAHRCVMQSSRLVNLVTPDESAIDASDDHNDAERVGVLGGPWLNQVQICDYEPLEEEKAWKVHVHYVPFVKLFDQHVEGLPCLFHVDHLKSLYQHSLYENWDHDRCDDEEYRDERHELVESCLVVFRLAQFDQRVVGQVEVHNLIVLQVDVESELGQLLLNQFFGFPVRIKK